MARNESILDSVKLYSLVPEETSIYDAQIMDLINSQLNTVKQLGVGNYKATRLAVVRMDGAAWESKSLYFLP